MEGAAPPHAPPGAPPSALGLAPLVTHATPWTPTDPAFKVTLNLALDGCIVPTADGGARTDYTRVIVLDGFLDDGARARLLDALTEPGWAGAAPPASKWERATCDTAGGPDEGGSTTDCGGGEGQRGGGEQVGAAGEAAAGPGSGGEAAEGRQSIGRQRRTWGLKDEWLRRLAEGGEPALLEVHSRLCKIWPEIFWAHMPDEEIQGRGAAGGGGGSGGAAGGAAAGGGTGGDEGAAAAAAEQQDAQQPASKRARVGAEAAAAIAAGASEVPLARDPPQQDANSSSRGGGAPPAVDCARFVANAAVAGDSFSWHVDADPATFPDSPWVDKVGRYFNREPGRPVFLSLLLYLDASWPRDHDAETLVLDVGSDCGVFIRPKPGRAVLMHQDAVHSDCGVCIRPKPGRAVLMHQDAVHRLSPPSALAGRPRYSLVWKLVALPQPAAEGGGDGGAAAGSAAAGGGSTGGGGGGGVCLARPEWGEPTYFGSAARLQQLVREAGRQKRAAGGSAGDG